MRVKNGLFLKVKKIKKKRKGKYVAQQRVYLSKKEGIFKSCLDMTVYVFVTVDCPFSQVFPGEARNPGYRRWC